MRISTSELRRDNIGQVVTLDCYDALTEEESVVTGIIEAFERKGDRMVITVGGTDYDFRPTDTIDIIRSMVLNEIIKQNGSPALSQEDVLDLMEEAVEPGSDFRAVLTEIIRETLTEVIQTELSELRN